MANIPIGGTLSTSANKPNIDSRFGPFASIQDAFSFIVNQNDGTIAGLHFGITNTDGTIKEYKWTKNNGTASNYVEVDKKTNVINNLTSTSTTDALSAKQGKELNEAIGGKANVVHTHSIANIVGLQEALNNIANNSTPGQGTTITDIKIKLSPNGNYTSIVNNGVAYIDLSNFVTAE